MKKLYRKSTVHPSPPIISDYLSFLPATIFALTVTLTADDKEVLAYLISCSNSTKNKRFSNFSGNRKTNRRLIITGVEVEVEHPPLFDCDCFMCYRGYWARWDTSPNRHLINDIIDAYEDGLAIAKTQGANRTQMNYSNKKDRRKRNNNHQLVTQHDESNRSSELSTGNGKGKVAESPSDSLRQETSRSLDGNGGEDNEEERGAVSRLVSFVGERIWSAWG